MLWPKAPLPCMTFQSAQTENSWTWTADWGSWRTSPTAWGVELGWEGRLHQRHTAHSQALHPFTVEGQGPGDQAPAAQTLPAALERWGEVVSSHSWPGGISSPVTGSGGLSYGEGLEVVQPGRSALAHIELVRPERGRSWCAAPIVVPRRDRGYRLCSPCRGDENVVFLLVHRYEKVGGDIVIFPIVQIQYIQGYIKLGAPAGSSLQNRC